MGRTALALGLTMLSVACGRPDPQAFEAELLAVDRAFDEAVQETGSTGWVSFFDEEGSFIQAGVGEIRGTEAIREAMLGLDSPNLDLTWEPLRAQGSDDGTLGYTVGTYESAVTTSVDTVRSSGRYVTIWRRQADGSLKVVMDLGNPLD